MELFKKITRYFLIALIVVGIIYYGFRLYQSKNHPFTAKLNCCSTTTHSGPIPWEEYFKDTIKTVQSQGIGYQIIGDIQNLPSDNADDYISVAFLCDIHNNTFDNDATVMETMVDSVPDNSLFLFANSLDPVLIESKGNQQHSCVIYIYKKSYTEEEIAEMLRNVSISVICNANGKQYRVNVEGMEIIKNSDVKF